MTAGSLDGRVMVIAFEGWTDAGEAASQTAKRLVQAFDLEAFDAIEPDDFIDFSVSRPIISTGEDGKRALAWPSALAYAPTRPSIRTQIASDAGIPVSTGAEGELFVLTGPEPNRNWPLFVENVIEIAQTCEVDTIVLLGAMLADVPHTRPIATSVTSENEELRTKLEVSRSTYTGPVGILTVIGLAAEEVGISTVNVWASVPLYVHAGHVPKATVALIDALSEVSDLVVPLEELPELASEWERNVNELADRDDDMRAYIGHLEQQRDAVDSPAASGEALAHEFEKFLFEASEPEEKPAATDESASEADSETKAADAPSVDEPSADEQLSDEQPSDELSDAEPTDAESSDTEPADSEPSDEDQPGTHSA
ncbi:PAC2 family protein [Humidisolicoccus flavus]|uniref:PAC2 family protein n=1 Tax=Humidisolicoccus flavus TaxID=3111414 RepID=UPI00324F8332